MKNDCTEMTQQNPHRFMPIYIDLSCHFRAARQTWLDKRGSTNVARQTNPPTYVGGSPWTRILH
ncbi:MAG: hypothetical protein ACRCUY_03275 [Thermoguttaceae bacterium]